MPTYQSHSPTSTRSTTEAGGSECVRTDTSSLHQSESPHEDVELNFASSTSVLIKLVAVLVQQLGDLSDLYLPAIMWDCPHPGALHVHAQSLLVQCFCFRLPWLHLGVFTGHLCLRRAATVCMHSSTSRLDSYTVTTTCF